MSSAYLQRVSFLLRQGEPVKDVAIYLPTDDAYARFTPGHVSVNQLMNELIGPTLIPQILDSGYNFDFIDDAAIAHDGIPYRILILPGVERVPLATLRAIEKYRASGGLAIATRRVPSLAPGISDQDAAQIRELSQEMFTTVHDDSALGEELRRILPPDFTANPAIGFVHRKTSDADIYFLVNTTNAPVHSQTVFRATGRNAAAWDPITGKTSGTRVNDIDLAPYESRVVVFSKGRALSIRPDHPAQVVDLSADWKITIAGATEEMAKLHSWTDDPRWIGFSGQATYEKTIRVGPSARPRFLTFGEGTPVAVGSERRAGSGMRAWIENPVREAAVVYVNGRRAGSVWRPPYEIEIGGLLKPGDNTIRVVVANLAINAMAGHPEDDSKLNARYGERFQAQDMNSIQPMPSGLLGPIHLITR